MRVFLSSRRQEDDAVSRPERQECAKTAIQREPSAQLGSSSAHQQQHKHTLREGERAKVQWKRLLEPAGRKQLLVRAPQ